MRIALLLMTLGLPALAGESGIVAGRVVDEAGKPIAGAVIGCAKTAMAETNDEGRFSVEVRGAHANFWISHNDHVSTSLACDAPSSGHRIVMKRGLAIAGRLVFPDGQPLARVRLTTWRLPAATWPRSDGWTEADGTFRFTGLREGERYRLLGLAMTHEATAGDETVEWVLEHPVLSLKVRNEKGEPLRVHRLGVTHLRGTERVRTWSSQSAGEGEHLVPVFDAERVLLSPFVPDHELPVLEVPTAGTPRLIRRTVVLRPLRQTSSFAFRIIDGRGRSPREVRLTLVNRAGASPLERSRHPRELGPEPLRFEHIPPGRYRLHVSLTQRDKSYRMGKTVEVDLKRGQETKATVVLPFGGRFRIRVKGVDADDARRSRWRVDVRDEEGGLLPRWPPFLSSGEWMTNGYPIPEGRYVAQILRGDEVIVKRPFEVISRAVTSLRISVPE